jgi:hypothetical protein
VYPGMAEYSLCCIGIVLPVNKDCNFAKSILIYKKCIHFESIYIFSIKIK